MRWVMRTRTGTDFMIGPMVGCSDVGRLYVPLGGGASSEEDEARSLMVSLALLISSCGGGSSSKLAGLSAETELEETSSVVCAMQKKSSCLVGAFAFNLSVLNYLLTIVCTLICDNYFIFVNPFALVEVVVFERLLHGLHRQRCMQNAKAIAILILKCLDTPKCLSTVLLCTVCRLRSC